MTFSSFHYFLGRERVLGTLELLLHPRMFDFGMECTHTKRVMHDIG